MFHIDSNTSSLRFLIFPRSQLRKQLYRPFTHRDVMFHDSTCIPGKGPRLCNKNRPSHEAPTHFLSFIRLACTKWPPSHSHPELSENRISPLACFCFFPLYEDPISDPFGSHQTRGWSPGWANARQGTFPPASRIASLNAWLLDHLGSKQFQKVDSHLILWGCPNYTTKTNMTLENLHFQ